MQSICSASSERDLRCLPYICDHPEHIICLPNFEIPNPEILRRSKQQKWINIYLDNYLFVLGKLQEAVTRLQEMQEEITKEIFKSVECCTVEQFGLLEDDERIQSIEEQLGVEVLSDAKELSNIGHNVNALIVDPSDY